MLTVAIDSSQETGVIALGKDSQLLAEYHFHCRMSLLRRLLPNIEQVLSDAGFAASDLDSIIIGTGPGSFTGLRIGITTAKSLAYVLDKPIVGIPSLQAIARGIAPAAADMICPMIFARANEVYWSLFDASAEEQLADYQVSTLDEALAEAQKHSGTVCFCGSGATRNHEQIRHVFGTSGCTSSAWNDFPRGAALLDLGMRRLETGGVDDPFALTPMYIRKPTPVIKLESGEFEKPGK